MKKIIALFSFLMTIGTLSSQTFMHGAGVGFNVSSPAGSSIDPKVFFTIHYYPQVTFVENESFSVSAGVPLTLGFTGTYSASFNSRGDSYEENSLLGLFQAPLMVNLNGGAGSSKESEQRFGYFVGGGFGYHGTGIEIADSGKLYSRGFGPAANAGIRFAVGSHQKNIEVRLSYMKGLKDYKPSMFGVNAAFNF
ncbi:MAG: hypothetical protein KIT80_02520 [Chitinophagaceae bacterium]|nr:hypothetical protein [Chitinophagaceae bacterium]MCW5925760.1 hypothetical protein [Chitinophagaceae bacterium]